MTVELSYIVFDWFLSYLNKVLARLWSADVIPSFSPGSTDHRSESHQHSDTFD